MADEVVATTPVVSSEKKIRGFVDLVKGAWGIFVLDWKAATLLLLNMFLLIFAVGAVVVIAGFSSMFTSGASGSMAIPSVGIFALLIALLAFVLFFAGAVVIGLALGRSVIQAGEGKMETVKESLAYGWANALNYIGVGLLAGIIVILLTLFLVLPGIWTGISLSMIAPVFVLEGLRGPDALRRSFALVKGHWWAVFGRLVLFAIVIGIIAGILGTNPVLNLFVPFVTTPLGIAYSYLIYKDLVAIKG